jgi:hypothetical protein
VSADPLAKVERLRDEFAAGAITWPDVRAAMPSKRLVWSSKWWKARRAELISDTCTKCGGQDGPMVLQHTSQTINIKEARQRVAGGWDEYKNAHPLQTPPDVFTERDACPKCQGLSIRYRKGTNDWFCDGVSSSYPRKRRHNPFAFVEPLKVQRPIKRSASAAHVARWQEYNGLRLNPKTERAAVLLCLDETIEYYRMTHTTTYCRRCAFIADRLQPKATP